MESNPDVVDEPVLGDDEGLFNPGGRAPAGDAELRQHGVFGAYLVAVERVARRRRRADGSVLWTAGQAAAQVVSRESVLDPLFDPGAIRGERNRVTVMGDQCVDIGLRGSYAFGDPEPIVRLLLVAAPRIVDRTRSAR